MPSTPRSLPSNSWTIDDADEGNISWAEDSDDALADDRRFQPTAVPAASRYRHQESSPAQGSATGSEFIMPSVNVLPTPRKPGHQSSKTKLVPPLIRTPHSPPASARSTPARTRKRYIDDETSYFSHIATYILSLLGASLRNLSTPLSWIISAYLLFGGLIILRNLVTSSISNALSPICRLPGVSLLNLPICTYASPLPNHPTIQSTAQTQPADPEFDALMTVQSKFDSLLSESSASLSLPFDMKRSETSIRDLREVVRFSTVPSKNELLHEFDGFVETARIASYDLQKFNSHVGRAVDNVLATARWTQRVLDDISLEKSTRGLIPAFIQDTVLAPFQPLQFTEARLLDQYIQHSQVISEEIARLVDEAQALLLVLTNLEDRLDVIHSVSLRDNIAARADRDAILGQLWTHLGGNRAKLGKVTGQLNLLGRVGQYRRLAYAHVSGTVVKLQAMGAELEELRTRVGAAEVVGVRDGVGTAKGNRAVPLSVHLESIRLGVERLEGQREKAREVERGHVRRVIDAAEVVRPGVGGRETELKLLTDA